MIHKNKNIIVSEIYRFPSQNNCELDSFLTNLDHLSSKINKCKPSLAVVTGDFNAGSPAWWTQDVQRDQNCFRFRPEMAFLN